MNSYEESYEPLENYDKALGKLIITGFIVGILFLVLLSGIGSAVTINAPDINAIKWINSNSNITITTYNNSWININNLSLTSANITINQSNTLNSSGRDGSFYVSAWFNSLNQSVNNVGAIVKGITKISWQIQKTTTNNYRILVMNASTTSAFSIASSCLGCWEQFGLSYSSNESLLRYYVNGVGVGSNTFVDINSTEENLIIGTRGGTNSYNGSIDSIRYYNDNLHTGQIQYDYYSNPRINDAGIMVFYFHNVSSNDGGGLNENTTRFTQKMQYLAYNNITAMTITEMYNWTQGAYKLKSSPSVVVEFDDGYKSWIETAAPIMKQYGIRGVGGITTSLIGTQGYLNTSDIVSLQDDYGWEIVAHSVTHPHFLTLTETEMITELNDSKVYLESLTGKEMISFTFPYNEMNYTIGALCGQFYKICFGNATNDNVLPNYIYKNQNLTNGSMQRQQVTAGSLNTFSYLVNPQRNITMNLELNENNGSLVYDSSGHNNIGILSNSSVWINDAISVTNLIFNNLLLNNTNLILSPINRLIYSFLINKQIDLATNYDYLINTDLYNSYELDLSQLTNSLIYFSNGSLACSDIATCDGNINITIQPNNYSYVLDNFNVTEGVIRQFSPISVSGISTSKTITSTLSQGVNATVIVNVAQCSLIAKYQNAAYNFDSCDKTNNLATFSLRDIPAGASVLTITYLDLNCSSNTSASVTIILLLSALAVASLSLILVFKWRAGELDLKIMIIVFIAIMVGIALFIATAQNLGGVCSA